MHSVSDISLGNKSSLADISIKPITQQAADALRDSFIDDGLDHSGAVVIVGSVLYVWDQQIQAWVVPGEMQWETTNW